MLINSGTYWHCICDDCGTSLYDLLQRSYDNKAVATLIAHSFGWQTGDRVTCNICLLINVDTIEDEQHGRYYGRHYSK
jgi:hypothetical protein